MFTSHKSQCRICKCDVVVQIAEDYPWSLEELLKLSTCNTCYDKRERRDGAIERVKSNCEWLLQHPRANSEQLKRVKMNLEKATKALAVVTSEYYGSKTVIWSEQFAENLMDNPGKWYEQLKFYRRAAAEQLRLQ